MLLALVTLCVVVSASAFADEVELFIDHGDTFIRAGTDQGLQRGTTVVILAGKERKPVGNANIMEVWAQLSRVSLDEPARADKTPQKYAVVAGAKTAQPVTPVPPPPAAVPSPSPAPPPPAAVPPAPRAPATPEGALLGHAVFRGAGRWKMLQLSNDNAFNWSQCQLTLMPNKQQYALPALRSQDHESIAWSNFSGDDRDKDPQWVWVRCAEGQVSLRFPE